MLIVTSKSLFLEGRRGRKRGRERRKRRRAWRERRKERRGHTHRETDRENTHSRKTTENILDSNNHSIRTRFKKCHSFMRGNLWR